MNLRHPTSRRRSRGFTLVELLVVIGVISILISILLPVVSRAQDQARSAACKSNLRQIYIAAQIYAKDNKQSLPYGFRFSPSRSDGSGSPASASVSPWISWFTTLNRTMDPRAYPELTNGSSQVGGFMGYKMSKVFQCPGANDFQQQVHYFQNSVAMPHLPLELKNAAVRTASGTVIKSIHSKPATFPDLYNDNALFWDTPLFATMSDTRAFPFFAPPQSNESEGANGVLATTYIDEGSLRLPLQPELRFRYPDRDLFAGRADGDFVRGDQSIFFPTDEQAATWGTTTTPLRTWNVDLGGNVISNKFYGNIRFRHQRNSIANVAFADGSVQAMTLNKSRVITGARGKSYETTFTRNMLRTKWPTGFGPSDQVSP